MPQVINTDDDWSDDDLDALLKPIQIVTAKRKPTTKSFLFEGEPTINTDSSQAAAIETEYTMESTDDGLSELELPTEPYVIDNKRRRKRGVVAAKVVYKMTICPFCAKQNKRLESHLKNCKMNPERKPVPLTEPFECALCRKKYTKRAGIMIHLRMFQGNIFPFKCEFCGEMYKYWGDRQMHIRRKHMVKPPFECNICNKGFCKQPRLQVHIRSVHTKETQFSCKFCNIKKSSKQAVQIHIKNIHSDLPPVYCDVCNKEFSHKKYLKQHYVMHTNEKITNVLVVKEPMLKIMF